MRVPPPRLFAAAVLAALAIALVINAGPWRSFARVVATDPTSKKTNTRQTALSLQPQQLAGSEPSLKSGAYFTIYRNEQGEAVCRSATEAEVRQMKVNTRKTNLRQINHPDLNLVQAQGPVNQGGGLTIILRATAQLQQNPAAVAAFTRAAQNWEALIMSPITIYIDVDFGPTFFGDPFPAGVLGSTGAPSSGYPYESARASLVAEANGEGNATKQAVVNALPSTTVPTDLGVSASTTFVDPAARALGLLPATAAPADPAAAIGFNSNFSFDFDPSDGIVNNQLDFDAVATHEIGHALGFFSEAGVNLTRPAVWDLYRFRTGTTANTFSDAQRILTVGGSPDPLQFFFVPGSNELGLSTGGPSGSFANGGDGWQSSHWKHSVSCSPYIGIMDPALGSGCRRTINSNDVLALGYLGYNLTNNNSPPPAPPTPTPPANDNFANAQIITACSGNTSGSTFAATSEPGEPSHDPSDSSSLSPSHTVWYQWQAPSSGNVTITTAGSDFDTVIAIYTGNSLNSLSRLTFNDDVQNGIVRTSSVTFNANAATIYRIAVDGWSADAGNVKLNWIGCGPTPTPSPTPTPTPQSCVSRFFLSDNGDEPDKNPGDGICMTTGIVCTLRAAIQEANALTTCGTIDIDMGNITTVINLNTALPDINHNVNLKGPVNGGVLTIQRSTLSGTPNFRIFNVLSGRTVNIIQGLVLSNGNLTFGNNGAAILNSGTLSVDRVSVTGNTTVNGSAIFNSSGTLTITNSTIANNDGGGIANLGILNLANSTVSGNTDTIGGAGIFNNGTLFVSNSTVSTNTVNGGGGGGAGILNNAGTAVVINSTVNSNTADAVGTGGAGIYNRATLTLVNSTISGNSAMGSGGGGIYNFNGGTLMATNCTVSGNRGGNGGGLNNGVATFNLRNTLVAGNTATGLGADALGSFNSLDFNLIGITSNSTFTGTTTHNVTNVNPMLGPLAFNGGPTQTHALLTGSPGINAGSNALAVDQNGNPLTSDQRGVGFNRIVSGTVDIGAFELAGPPVLLVDSTNHVIAIDSVTFARDPFSVVGSHNFSSDQRTRVMIFISNLGLNQPSPDLFVTEGGLLVSIEGVGTVAGMLDVSYIIVRLDPFLSGNVPMSVTVRGVTTNTGILSVSP